MRYLLIHHPVAVCVVLFIAGMTAIKYAIAPYIVHSFGHVGFVIAILAIMAVTFLAERRGY